MSDPYISPFGVEHAEPVAKGISYYAGRVVGGASKGGLMRRLPGKVGRSLKGDFAYGKARGKGGTLGARNARQGQHEQTSRVARRVGRRQERWS